MRLDDDMRRVVAEQSLGFVATVCANGTPNLSPKGTTIVWDDERLVFLHLFSPMTIANLAANPAIEVNVVDPIVRKGYRFKGRAEVLTEGDLHARVLEHFRSQRGTDITRVQAVVMVTVDSAAALVSPAYDAGAREPDIVRRWRDHHVQLAATRLDGAARTLRIVDYDPAWPGRAAEMCAQILGSGRDAAYRVEHIGSTSIPGMAAKDVIDLQASVADFDRAAAALDAPLSALGFERLPYEHDHVPAGRSDDPEQWVKRLWARRGHRDGDVNLHIRLAGSPNERLALLFRDWFRAHPEAVPAYAAFKRSLAAELDDVGAYSDVKDPVVDLVITIAEPWAAETGWSDFFADE
jgi:GrpB-like predicted nucleotidyltransferase (UPF0157 family)/predicted pyridoxine 5'-phosphate oxidase superfamily flavin-nucleotide-binding protein